MWRRSSINICALAMLTLACAGCGSDLAVVTGRITLDGKPLQADGDVNGTVSFQPASGQGTVGYGFIDEDGSYQVASGSKSGLAPGEYVVTCTASQMLPAARPGLPPTPKRITPKQYASAADSGLRFTIQPGDNEIDLALKSGPSR